MHAATDKRHLGSDAGMTLIEVLVSALIVILIGSATATALIATSHVSGQERLRSQADAVAAQDQDRLRGLSDQQLSGLNQTRQETVNGQAFTVKSTAAFIDSSGAASCTSNAAAYFSIASAVTWTQSGTSRPVTITEQSVVSRPIGASLITNVLDPAGQPLAGATVTITSGTPSASGTTDSTGCVVLAGLAGGGTYSETVTPDTGTYVGWAGSNGYTAPITLSATLPTTGAATAAPDPIYVGQAAPVTANFTSAPAGYTAEASGVSYKGPTAGAFGLRMTAPATQAASPSPGTSAVTPALYPFDLNSTPPASYTNNYTVWAGKCPGMEPPTANLVTATVAPGSFPPPVSVPEPMLNFAGVTVNNTALKPRHVKLTYTDNTGCTDTWSATIGQSASTLGWLANPGQPFASSSAAASASGDYGTYTICADYRSSGQWYRGSVSGIQNSSFAAATVVPTITLNQSSASC